MRLGKLSHSLNKKMIDCNASKYTYNGTVKIAFSFDVDIVYIYIFT